MTTLKFYFLLLSPILLLQPAFSQGFNPHFLDGSFEELGDPTKSDLPRTYWTWNCSPGNSPDRQPGYWGVTEKSHHGNQFLGLVTKNMNESVGQRIDMQENEDYFVVMYLASSKGYGPNGHQDEGSLTLWWGTPNYTTTPGRVPCPRVENLLWTSPTVAQPTWSLHVANFRSSGKGWLNLQAGPTETYPYQTNILVDSIAGPFLGKWPFPELGADQLLCEGDTALLELPTPGINGVRSEIKYRWSDGFREASRFIVESGEYQVCSVWKGLKQCDTVKITFESQPQPNIGLDSVACIGDTVRLDAGIRRPDYLYSWSDGLEDSVRLVSQSNELEVVLTNGICTAVRQRTLLFKDYSAILEMPNVFSPNGDGINDIFRPMNAINIYSIQIDIFDRWGRKVAVLRSLDQGWDGTNSLGQALPEGVYFWAARYQGVEDEEVAVVKGNVMLVR